MAKIREAEYEDAAEIAGLLDSTEAKIREDLPRRSYYVAVEKGKVVGAISLLLGDITCRIEDIAVKEGFQRKGIGTKLMESAEDVAKEHGCSIIWCTASKDEEICGFYRAMGFVAKDLPKSLKDRNIIKMEKSLK